MRRKTLFWSLCPVWTVVRSRSDLELTCILWWSQIWYKYERTRFFFSADRDILLGCQSSRLTRFARNTTQSFDFSCYFHLQQTQCNKFLLSILKATSHLFFADETMYSWRVYLVDQHFVPHWRARRILDTYFPDFFLFAPPWRRCYCFLSYLTTISQETPERIHSAELSDPLNLMLPADHNFHLSIFIQTTHSWFPDRPLMSL